MNQHQNEPLSITVDGAKWPVEQLPAHIQQMFYLYQEWNNQLDNQRKEVFKLESAIRAVSAEVEARIRVHANEQRELIAQMTAPKAEDQAA